MSCPSGVCRPHSLNIFSSETAWPFKVRLHMEPPWDGGTEVCSDAMPYMVKTLKNLLLRNQKVDDLEALYAASGARILRSLFK